MIEIRTVRQTVQVHGTSPRVVVTSLPATTVKVVSAGPRGPKGERGDKGDRGDIGPVGSFDDGNLPDFALIFENQLV